MNSIPGGTNNQNGQFDFRNTSSGRTGLGIADMALGLFTNYAEIGERARTNWRALATDIFVQDSWRPTSDLTIEGGFRYALWQPWYSTTNNIANFDPRFYDKNERGGDQPRHGPHRLGPALQRHRPARRRFRRRGERPEGRERPGRSGALPR